MSILGDATPGITALVAQMPDIITKLAGGEHDAVAQLLTGAQVELAQLTATETNLVNQAAQIVSQDLAPLIAESQAWRALVKSITDRITILPPV